MRVRVSEPSMNIRDTVSFFLQAASVGIVVAFLLLKFRPEWFESDYQPVVEVRQAPAHQAPAAVTSLSTGPVSYADVIEPAAKAVVNIYTAKLITRERHPLLDDPIVRYFFGDRLQISPRQQLQTSLGSGVIVSEQGYVLTNSHVIEGADEIQVLLEDGRTAEAEVVGVDDGTDLAVLRIALNDLPTVKIGTDTNLRVGDVVLAIGNPYGVGQTVTLGIISATGRNQLGISRYEDFIQTDAAINPGNSGGALINAWGELIGINTAIFSKSGGSQGIGFAIPAHQATNVLKQIIEHGYVKRGWLGIEAQDLTAALAETFDVQGTRGMLIAGVLRGSPADQAGIKPGDVIEKINGAAIHNARSAVALIARLGPGAEVRLSGTRKGKPIRLTAKTGSQPQ